MSRGLGHLERTILAMVERQRRKRQRVNFTALDIEYEAYPGTPPTHAQHVAVLRSMHSSTVRSDRRQRQPTARARSVMAGKAVGRVGFLASQAR
jgi:hypothetical protein